MSQEEYLLSFAPQISDTTDPLQDELEPLLNDYQITEDELNATKDEYTHLKSVKKPIDFKEVWLGKDVWLWVLVISAIVIFILSLIIWGGFWKSLLRMLIGSVAVTVIDGLIHVIQEYRYQNYQVTKASFKSRIDSIQKESDEKYKAMQPKLEVRFGALHLALNKGLGLPYPMSGITLKNYQEIKNCYLALLREKETADLITDRKERMEANRRYIDDKITFLYTHSLRKEVSKEVYDEFKQQLLEAEPGNMALRKETTDKNSKGISEIFRIPKYKEMLDDDHLTPIVDKFNAVANRDTRGLIFQDTDKKAQQTKDMNKLLKAANFEYNELITINNRVSYALDYARGCAYRNIYLASELINYVLGSSRGGGLTSVKDSMNISSIDATVDVNSYKLNESSMDSAMNVIANISDTILSSIDNKEMERFISKNPKTALGAAVVTGILALGAGIKTYYKNLEANAEAQSKITDGIKTISEGYTKGKSQMLRKIEILGGIVKCNDGFMAVYEPLREKVFDNGNLNLTKMDIMQFAAAAKEYSKVAKSTIN